MEKETLEEISKTKFGFHRGLFSREHPQDSLEAIRAALALSPPFVEFDVVLKGGEVWTGHPPQPPQSKLSQVLPLFRGPRTYPKIDIRSKTVKKAKRVVEEILDLLEKERIDFALFCFTEQEGPRAIMQMEDYLAKKAKGNPRVRLHIDLRKYGSDKGTIRKETLEHLKRLGDFIHSIGVEIHEEDAQRAALVAKKFGIGQIQFWVRSGPDIPRPKVTKEEIRKTLALEGKYGLEVFFDINPRFIEGFGKIGGEGLN